MTIPLLRELRDTSKLTPECGVIVRRGRTKGKYYNLYPKI